MKYVRHFLEDVLAINAGLLQFGLFGSCNISVQQFSPKYLGSQALLMNNDNFTFRTRSGFTFGDIEADPKRANAEVRIGFTTGASLGAGTNPAISIGVRVSGSAVTWSGYFADLLMTSNLIQLTNGTGSPTDQPMASAAFTFAPNTLYHAVFSAQGSVFGLKVWADGTNEPAAFTITVNDSTLATAGSIMIGTALTNGACAYTVHYVCVGTNGDASPARPKTWAEYLDYIGDSRNVKCLLAELTVFGTNPGSPTPATGLEGKIGISNMSFVTDPADLFPNTPFEEILRQAPQIKRRLSSAFTGLITMTYGDLIVKNQTTNASTPVTGEVFTGRLDSWLGYNFNGRRAVLMVGSPSWRRCDFKTTFRGSIADVYRAGYALLGFKLRGPEVVLTLPLTQSLIGGTGPNASSLAPRVIGPFFNAEPPYYDTSLWKFFMNDTGFSSSLDVRDSGASLNQPLRTITAWGGSPGLDVISLDAVHNLVPNATVIFSLLSSPTPTLPAEIVAGTVYYVKDVPTSKTLRISNTLGGPSINVSSTPVGAQMLGRLYYVENTGAIVLLSKPAGRVTVSDLGRVAGSGGQIGTVSTCVDTVMNIAGVGFIKSIFQGATFNQQAGTWYPNQVSLGQAITDFATSIGGSLCFNREGFYYLMALNAPTGTPTWTVDSGYIRNWTQGMRELPRYAERLGYQQNFAIEKGGDLVTATTDANRDLYGKSYSLTTYVPSDSGIDQPSNNLLATTMPDRPTTLQLAADAQTESQRLYNLRRGVTGTYTFDTDAWALGVEIGDELSITYPRDGFSAGADAIVVGTVDDYSKFQCNLEVWAKIGGVWPAVTSMTQPFIDGSNY